MMLLAYLGPDTLLPMTSVFAAAVGFAAMFGKNGLTMAARCMKRLTRMQPIVTRGLARRSVATESQDARNDLLRQPRWRGPVVSQRGVRSNSSVRS